MGSRFAIVNPCAKRWQDLRGDGRRRHCDECRKDVHAMDQYSPKEWDELWRASNGCVCGFLGGESAPEPRSRREVLVAALLTAVAPLMAQSGRVRIVVKDPTGTVIANAEAVLHGGDGKAIRTNDAGEIVWTDLPLGSATFVVRSSGFMQRSVTVMVRNGEEVRAEVTLEPGTVGTVVAVPMADESQTVPSETPVLTISTTTPAVQAPEAARSKRRRWWKFWQVGASGR